jgi:phage baseplate assembly protein W
MGERAYLEGDEALMQRVQLVLATPPGSLPWREDFGCGIWSLLGQPATPQKLGDARWKVEEALARWVPEAELQSCEVTLLPGRDPQGLRALLRSPLESGLLHLGVDAVLQLELTLRTREGVLRARLELLEALP